MSVTRMNDFKTRTEIQQSSRQNRAQSVVMEKNPNLRVLNCSTQAMTHFSQTQLAPVNQSNGIPMIVSAENSFTQELKSAKGSLSLICIIKKSEIKPNLSP